MIAQRERWGRPFRQVEAQAQAALPQSRERLAVGVAAGDDSLSREGEGWGEGDQGSLCRTNLAKEAFPVEKRAPRITWEGAAPSAPHPAATKWCREAL
jgi:hypothetical protein